MTNATSNATATGSNPTAAKTESAAESKRIVLKEIGSKWDRFSEQELSALKDNNELVTQVVAKYGLEKVQAQRDVDALMKGRQI
jgi:division protein CdvB (Snf7/Vps24/ESCRT-III family)